MPRRLPSPTYVSTSAGGYEVHAGGHLVGHVGKAGHLWSGRMLDGMTIGEHRTRREAAAALIDVDSQ